MSNQLVNKIRETRERLQNHAIAKKIFDLMRELRTESNAYTERRWIWELIQNAKDVSYATGISIKIEHDEHKNHIVFSHSGQAFSIDNIVGLIEQIGTKERNIIIGEGKKPIGKFGTGFLTTHLLSEKVNVASYLEEPAGKYIPFNLDLDRSGRSLEEVSKAVNLSIGVLETICKETLAGDFNPKNFNTSFTYFLNGDKEMVAKTGIDDLVKTIPFTLAFVSSIKEIHLKNDKIRFFIQSSELIRKGIELVCVQKEFSDKKTIESLYILVCSDDHVNIAIPIAAKENVYSAIRLEKDIPRVFCEFPLIGTEGFGLPFIINSSGFNPTKDRNGIALTDKDDQIVTENKSLVIKAVQLYQKVLDYVSGSDKWINTLYLADLNEMHDNQLISAHWYKNEILQPLKYSILRARLANTVDHGRCAIEMDDNSTIDFPYHKDDETLNELWELCRFSDVFILPAKEELEFWKSITWLKDYRLTTEKLISWVADQKDIEKLSDVYSRSEQETYAWLNRLLVYLINSEQEALINKYQMIPNQYGSFTNKANLYRESENIDEDIKDIAMELGKDFRAILISKNINIGKELIVLAEVEVINDYLIPESRTMDTTDVASEIERILKNRLQEVPRSVHTKSVSKKLMHWFNRNPEKASKAFNFLYEERHLLRDDSQIIEDMQKADTLDRLVEKSGCTHDEIEQLVKSGDAIIIRVDHKLYPESEDEIEQSLSLMDNSDEKSRISISEEAKLQVFQWLREKGFSVPKNLDINYTIVDGIINPDGIPVMIVVKSAKAGRIYFNPTEWLALSSPDTQLFIVTSGNVVRNITVSDLEQYNNTFHMRFNTHAFTMANIGAFAKFFRYLPYTHFIFDAPLSTTDFLKPFGLNERNPSANDLTPDDKKLLA